MFFRSLMLPFLLAGCSADVARPIDSLKWLTGGWRDAKEETTTYESWNAQPDGSLLGTGRVQVGKLLGFAETLAIVGTKDGFVYTAWPAGQDPVRFAQKRVSEFEVSFENLSHDFPRTITYKRIDATHLSVQAVGVTDGNDRQEQWELERLP